MFHMFTSPFTRAAVVAGCFAAAAGGYVATLQNSELAMPAVEATPEVLPTSAAREPELQPIAVPSATPTQDSASSGAGRRAAAVQPAPRQTAAPAARSQAPQTSRREAPPERTVAADIASPPAVTAATQQEPSAAQVPPIDHTEDDPIPPVAAAAELPAVTAQELVVATDSVIGLQLDSTITSEQARIEDNVRAHVVRDVRVDGNVAIAAGSKAVGSVTTIERGGRFKERAQLGIRFHTLELVDGTHLPITTETVYRYGDSPVRSTATKIGGGAAVGAILGGIVGGGKGAAVGAGAGAGAGTAVVMAGGRNEAAFLTGTEITARILAPVTVTIEK
jgi:hypothetical protein